VRRPRRGEVQDWSGCWYQVLPTPAVQSNKDPCLIFAHLIGTETCTECCLSAIKPVRSRSLSCQGHPLIRRIQWLVARFTFKTPSVREIGAGGRTLRLSCCEVHRRVTDNA
jgi:hypothetical protein